MSRDNFRRQFRCPNCESSGRADLSQEDGWSFVKGNTATEVEYLSPGFETLPNRAHEFGFEIHCSACKVKVERL